MSLPVLWAAGSVVAFCVMVGALPALYRGMASGQVEEPPTWCWYALAATVALFVGGCLEVLLGL